MMLMLMLMMMMMMMLMMMMNSVVSERNGGYHCLRRDLNEHSARNMEQDNGGDEVEVGMKRMKMTQSLWVKSFQANSPLVAAIMFT